MWIAQARKRFKDHTTYVDAEAEESSKAIKDPNTEDREAFRGLAIESQATQSDAFLQTAARNAGVQLGLSLGPGVPAPAGFQSSNAAGRTSGGPVLVQIGAPRGGGGGGGGPGPGGDGGDDDPNCPRGGPPNKKQRFVEDEAPRYYGKWSQHLPKLKGTIAAAIEKLNAALSVRPMESDDPQMKHYRHSALARSQFGHCWLASDVSEAKQALAALPAAWSNNSGSVQNNGPEALTHTEASDSAPRDTPPTLPAPPPAAETPAEAVGAPGAATGGAATESEEIKKNPPVDPEPEPNGEVNGEDVKDFAALLKEEQEQAAAQAQAEAKAEAEAAEAADGAPAADQAQAAAAADAAAQRAAAAADTSSLVAASSHTQPLVLGTLTRTLGTPTKEKKADDGCESVSASAASGGKAKKSLGKTITDILQSAMKKTTSKASQGQCVANVEHLISALQLEELMEAALALRTMEQLNESAGMWMNCSAQVKHLASSMNKSAQNLVAHVKLLKRKEDQDIAHQQRRVEQQAVHAARSQAAVAAQVVQQGEKQVPAFYKITMEDLIACGKEMRTVDGSTIGALPMEPLSVDEPYIFKNFTCTEKWAKQPKVQVALGSFGGRYKRMETFKTDLRSQQMLAPRCGYEETSELFDQLCKCLDQRHYTAPAAVKVEIVKKVAKVAWLFGYDAKMRWVSAAPTGLAILKHMAQGEVKVVTFEFVSLLDAMRATSGKEKISYDQIKESLPALDVAGLRQLKDAGAKFEVALQVAGQAIYVPPGWIIIEESMRGVLLYGARKTLVVSSEKAVNAYQMLIGAMDLCGKPTTSMNAAVPTLELPEDGED